MRHLAGGQTDWLMKIKQLLHTCKEIKRINKYFNALNVPVVQQHRQAKLGL